MTSLQPFKSLQTSCYEQCSTCTLISKQLLRSSCTVQLSSKCMQIYEGNTLQGISRWPPRYKWWIKAKTPRGNFIPFRKKNQCMKHRRNFRLGLSTPHDPRHHYFPCCYYFSLYPWDNQDNAPDQVVTPNQTPRLGGFCFPMSSSTIGVTSLKSCKTHILITKLPSYTYH